MSCKSSKNVVIEEENISQLTWNTKFSLIFSSIMHKLFVASTLPGVSSAYNMFHCYVFQWLLGKGKNNISCKSML